LPVIPALGRLRQEDHKFETSLGYIESWTTQGDPVSKIQQKFVNHSYIVKGNF
jgi:hypothetical protein